MKIDSLSPNPLSTNQPEGAGSVKKSDHADQTARTHAAATDRAELSERARLMGKARTALQNTPDVNQDKVNSVKQRVDNGTYQVPADELARRLLHRVNQIPPE